jgi:hypothetical protein
MSPAAREKLPVAATCVKIFSVSSSTMACESFLVGIPDIASMRLVAGSIHR